ncbi:hypothetical protein [Agrobacterium sp. 22-226-1]
MASEIIRNIRDPDEEDGVRRFGGLLNNRQAEDAIDAAAVLLGRMLDPERRVARITVDHLVMSVQAALGSRTHNRRIEQESNSKECRKQPPHPRSLYNPAHRRSSIIPACHGSNGAP